MINTLLRKFSAIFTMFLLAGCASRNIEVAMVGSVFLRASDLKVTLTHIPPDVLRERHGRNTSNVTRNPYLDFPSVSSPKRIVVFRFQAETTSSEIQFLLDNIKLSMEGTKGKAADPEYLLRIWDVYVNESEKSSMKSILKRTILKEQFTVSSKNPADAYLVFAEDYPEKGGDSVMSFNVTSADGSAGFLEIPFYFGEPKATQENNTGIFAQN